MLQQVMRGAFKSVLQPFVTLISPFVDSPVLDLLCHGQEGLFDIGSALGRRLEEGDTQLVGEFL